MDLDFRTSAPPERAPIFERRPHGHPCAECRYAQVFAAQPRAVYVASAGAHAGHIMSATHAACTLYVTRPADDTGMAQSLAQLGHAPAAQFAPAA